MFPFTFNSSLRGTKQSQTLQSVSVYRCFDGAQHDKALYLASEGCFIDNVLQLEKDHKNDAISFSILYILLISGSLRYDLIALPIRPVK
jgi:hypothetical protein